MKIKRISKPINTIKAGPNSQILQDGTITNPEEISVSDIELENGIIIQVERPLTKAKIKKALGKPFSLDGVKEGDDLI